MTFVLILYFDWLLGPHIGQNFEKHSKICFSETVKGIKPVLCIHVPDSGLHRLIMGKVEIGYFSAKIADILILFLQKCLLSSV